MLLVFTLLLKEIGILEAKEVVCFIRATIDFIILAIYESYNEDTLRYFNLALYRIN
jgi:hypothetical protein